VSRPHHIALLGSTGSIGRNSLEVIAAFPERFRVAYLTAHRNIGLLQEQIQHFRPRGVVVLDGRRADELRKLVGGSVEVLAGEEALEEVVRREDVDLVLSALVGFAGVRPTLAAVHAGKDVALANKEALVVAGELIMRAVRERGTRLLPVDSEHSAILQCLRGEDVRRVERLILTASGGPFLDLPAERLAGVTVEEALNHPTWKMGTKITIDSATLMNKGLEVIEAFWLFGLPPEKIEVVIHPQSVIHSMVEFADGSVKAQMGLPDMRIPIQYALMFPDRPPAPFRKVEFAELGALTFRAPDTGRFPCLALAFRALAMGGTAPAVLNAANEVAVELFLEGKTPFTGIAGAIAAALDGHTPDHDITPAKLVETDRRTREEVRQRNAGQEED
jgi:1-deoxy-D-xylulose-5-phosphate reductoisomerase